MSGRWLRILLVVVLAAGIAVVLLNRDRIDPAALEAWVAAAGWMGPALFILVYALGAVFFVPGSVMTLAGGALFGPVWGTLLNLAGATLGATLAFLVARYVASDWVARRAGGRLAKLIHGVEAEGWRFVAFTRLVPLFPFNLLNYALGLTRIPLVSYALTTAICMAPGALAYTYVGYAGRQAVAGGETAIQTALIALGLLAAVAFLPRLVQRMRGPSEWVDAAELARRLEGAEPPVVVDVRGPDEFEGELGHIDGALNLPLDELENRLDEIPADRPLALVCKTDRRSLTAARQLRTRGFPEVAVVRGGMTAWRAGEGAPSGRG